MSKTDKRIEEEFERAKTGREEMPNKIGIFSIMPANDAISEAKTQQDPKSLFKSLFFEGEVCVGFADTNNGKSIFAVQMADHITKEFATPVLYIDFELSKKQFQIRYTDEKTGESYKFADCFYRVEIDLDQLDTGDLVKQVLEGIKGVIQSTGARVLIVDNITYLCDDCEKGDQASKLMKELVVIKKQNNVSLLVIAHTPKRLMTMPITQNDLAGSKKIANFCDSIFAIGASAKDSNLRYIKQIKSRNCAKVYDQDNVLVCKVTKTNAFLHFEEIGTDKEKNHLRPFDDYEKEVREMVADLSSQGQPVRRISQQLGISKTTVNGIQHKIKFEQESTEAESNE